MTYKYRYGFTLIEIIIAAAISSLVLGTTMTVWRYSNRSIARTVTKQNLQADARRILNYLEADIKAAKADSFKSSGTDNLTLSFDRYIRDTGDATKLLDKIEKVTYVFAKPTIKRQIDKSTRILSHNVESIVIARKTLTEAQQKTEKYLESRIDISLNMLGIPAGTNLEERFVQSTSAVIREEYYKKQNEERKEIVSIAPLGSSEESSNGLTAGDIGNIDIGNSSSAYFLKDLSLNALAMLTTAQLDDLNKTQVDMISQAEENIAALNKQIGDVETGESWYERYLWFDNEEGENVRKLKNELEGVPKPNGKNKDTSSKKVEEILKTIETDIGDTEDEFMKLAFGEKNVIKAPELDPKADIGKSKDKLQDEANLREEAELQQRAYDMCIADRTLKKAKEEMDKTNEAADSAEEGSEGGSSEEDNSGQEGDSSSIVIKFQIDNYNLTEEQIRDNLLKSGLYSEKQNGEPVIIDKEGFEERVKNEFKEQESIRKYYNACNLDNVDKNVDEKKLKAYEGLKSLKNLAESKLGMYKIMEQSNTNINVIAEARKVKNEKDQDQDQER